MLLGTGQPLEVKSSKASEAPRGKASETEKKTRLIHLGHFIDASQEAYEGCIVLLWLLLLFIFYCLLLIINVIWQLPQTLRVGFGEDRLGLNCVVLVQLLNLAVFSFLIFGLEMMKAESSQNRGE